MWFRLYTKAKEHQVYLKKKAQEVSKECTYSPYISHKSREIESQLTYKNKHRKPEFKMKWEKHTESNIEQQNIGKYLNPEEI